MRWLVACVVLAACGSDDLHPTAIVEGQSGSRLALGAFRFDDGTELAYPTELYDKLAHVRCAPGRWLDGELRCVPIADEALYIDATCETFVGRADTDSHPTAFVGYEQKAGVRSPAHLLRAGAATTAPAGFYRKRDGMCVGPEFTDPSITYFSIPGEYEDAAAFGVDEVAGARIALELTTSTDGARWIASYFDLARSADCTLLENHRCGAIELDAAIEHVGSRRIQRIELSDGDLRFLDARVHDTQLDIECTPQMVDDTWRCMPESISGTATYHAAGCIDPLPVAVVLSARPAKFVSVFTPDTRELHAIGGPIVAYVGTPFSCAPAVPPPGYELHEIGALVPVDAFASAILYTAR